MSSPPPFQVLAVLPSEQAGYVALVSGPHVHLHMLAPPFAPLASTSTLLQADQHGWLVRTAAVSHDGRWIATGCDGKELRVWEVAEGGSAIKLSSVRCVLLLDLPQAELAACRIAADVADARSCAHTLWPLRSKILKKIAAISFNSKNEIVFGDKLGDAYTSVPILSPRLAAAVRLRALVVARPDAQPRLSSPPSPATRSSRTPIRPNSCPSGRPLRSRPTRRSTRTARSCSATRRP